MPKLNNRLTVLREEKGWSKAETARRLGLNATSTYGNWEYGIREPDIDMLRHISIIFDVSVDYLIGQRNDSDYKPSEIEKRPDIANKLEDIRESLRFENDLQLDKKMLHSEVIKYLDDSIVFLLNQARSLNNSLNRND
ncbi:helix-turn-helix transcriptional regulator [Listeria weihenstephanensis]|uniref:Transcriptional regulator n=1 Tax=Listeria weihenstephanensis TaxID=1006155 RepID=A0A1S7FU44_9LIST|nr:helix-turn-helix transcriptional regulator [Listeria weihenstephanensis]AQY50974.1 transcriptional regulator [Listeria weihenstephanensis]MBC1499916.1 helix-turn-helix transcriptional regulator [Listeria weihenstephanensis]